MLKYNRGGRRKAAKWPENWSLPDTGFSLGVDEFDLLMVAHALEHRLVLVADDEMSRIRDGLGEAAAELQVEDWTLESSPPGEA
jgi:predicted nucleic acid-binding protein